MSVTSTGAKQPNTILRAALREHGFTQEELASLVNGAIIQLFGSDGVCTGVHVRRWTSGAVRWPHPKYLLALEVVFDRPILDLGFIPRSERSLDHLTQIRATISSESDTFEEDPVQRRDFIGAAAGTALVGTTASATASLPASLSNGRRIGVSDVDALRLRLAQLHALDGKFGGADLVKVALHGYVDLSTAIASCSYSESTSRRLYSLAGEFATSAGWFSFDAGDQPTAERQYNLALKMALMAGDHILQAHVLIAMALQSLHMGDAAECAAIARAALEQKAARQNATVAANPNGSDSLAQRNSPASSPREHSPLVSIHLRRPPPMRPSKHWGLNSPAIDSCTRSLKPTPYWGTVTLSEPVMWRQPLSGHLPRFVPTGDALHYFSSATDLRNNPPKHHATFLQPGA